MLPDDYFVTKLEEELLKLPSYTEQHERNDSWMTSKEIAQHFLNKGLGEYLEEEIEDFLLNKLRSEQLFNIRPAKYPNLRTMHTLWGHKAKTYPISEPIQPWKKDKKLELEEIDVPRGAPVIFLSHSAKDFELAKKVRRTLGEHHGFESWLFEKEMDKDINIAGSVKLGIIHCDAVILLLTSNSIGSAWIDTEIQTANSYYKKQILTLIDGQDEDLLFVVKYHLKNESGFPENLLDKILMKYKLQESSESRINKFKINAGNVLNYLGLYSDFSVYPQNGNDKESPFVEISEALVKLRSE